MGVLLNNRAKRIVFSLADNGVFYGTLMLKYTYIYVNNYTTMERINKLIESGKSTRFSSTNQPKRRRKSLKKILNDVLDNEGFMVIGEGDFEVQKDGTCHVFIPDLRKVCVSLVKQASEGDLQAINMIFDRIEGKPGQSLQVIEPNIQPHFFEAMEVEGEENTKLKKAE